MTEHYYGPRWDRLSYGDERSVEGSGFLRNAGFAHAWFDADLPSLSTAAATHQLTVGYIHDRFDANGLNLGVITGFFGHGILQWSTRWRPSPGSRYGYQLTGGLRVGTTLEPYLGIGLVLPDIGGTR